MKLDRPLPKSTFGLLFFSILLVTFLSFVPVLANDFVNYDDTKYLLFNADVKELSPDSLKAIFTPAEGKPYHYVPLTLASFALEHHFFGLDPRVYHLNNLILHVANTGLVFVFIWLLTRQWLMAALVALLFGIHPMHVESVAWVSERKDVLYSFFFLGGLILYLEYILHERRGWLIGCFALFVLSGLAKPMAVTFPFLLLLIDFFYKRPDKMKAFLEKVPFFLVAAVFVKLLMIKKAFAVIEFDEGFSWFERFLIASYTFFQYTIKAVFPSKLSAFHPYPLRIGGQLPGIYYIAPFLSLGLSAGLLYLFRKNWGVIFGFLFYVLSIVPVLNFYPLGNMLMAERYTYIAYIGLFFVLARLAVLILQNAGSSLLFRRTAVAALTGFIIILSAQTIGRTQVWRNSETLWDDVVRKYPKEPFAYYNMADHFVKKGRIAQAILEYSNTIAVDPRYFSAYNNRGNLYLVRGRYEEAVADYQRAIEIFPEHVKTYLNLAAVHTYLGDHAAAAAVYDKVLKMDPGNRVAQENLQMIRRSKKQ